MERRTALRVPVNIFMNQYVMDQPFRSLVTSLSSSGLYARRLILPFDRPSPIVTVEVPLPGTTDSIVARGEIAYDAFDPHFHETGIHFADMPRKHRRMVRDFCEDRRQQILRTMMASIRARLAGREFTIA
jgi:PilZ domain-containing protein